MRKQTLILLLLACLPLWGTAADLRSEFTLGVQGGMDQWGYEPALGQTLVGVELPHYTMDALPGLSAGAELDYRFFFCRWMGIGVGVDVMRYGSRLKTSGEYVWLKKTDTDGEQYDHHLALTDWQENHAAYTVEVPLVLAFSIPAGAVNILLEVGGKWGLPFTTQYSGKGDITHTGYYAPWDLTLHDTPPYGFYSTSSYRPKGALPAWQIYWAVTGRVGVAIPFADRWDVRFSAVANRIITPVENWMDAPSRAAWQPGFKADHPGMDEQHYFMGDYQSYLLSPLTSGHLRPWTVGLEAGISYHIRHRVKEKCPCRVYLWN